MKICANCAYYSPTSYNGEVVDYQGCCTHIAFYKTGMARVGADGNLCDWQFREQRTKPPKSVVISLLEKGYLWVNTLSCRQRYVTCPHYHHPITYLGECMEKGICSDDMLRDKLPLFRKFLKAKKALRKIHYSILGRICMGEGDSVEPVEEYSEYPMCSTCKYYHPLLSEEGSPIPFRGVCNVMNSDTGLFAMCEEKEVSETLSFLSCGRYSEDPRFRIPKTGVGKLSPKMLNHIETNLIHPSYEQLSHAFRLEHSWTRPTLTKEALEVLLRKDLDVQALARCLKGSREKFDGENGLNVVSEYFMKHIRENSEKDRFVHLKC